MPIYTNAQPLECCEFKNLNRQVGVSITQRYTTHASLGDAVDIHFERPSLNTSCAGGWKATSDATKEVELMTNYVIEDLDRVISELTAHRDRLIAERQHIAAHIAAALEPTQ